MGYTTDFIGHIDINPMLNDAEQAYLQAFSRARRWDREEGPYVVPGNPAAEEQDSERDRDSYNRTAPGQPELYCQWVPCWDGCCLAFEVQHEFCEVRWPRTPRPATGLCADERRSVSDRLRGPGTTGCSLTARTARKQP